MISYMSRIFRVQVEREEPSLSWENREDVVVRYTDEITDAAHLNRTIKLSLQEFKK